MLRTRNAFAMVGPALLLLTLTGCAGDSSALTGPGQPGEDLLLPNPPVIIYDDPCVTKRPADACFDEEDPSRI